MREGWREEAAESMSDGSRGVSDGEPPGPPPPGPPAPLTQFAFFILVLLVFLATQQPLVVVLAVLLGAPLFEPIFGWLAHHSDPWLEGRLGRALPSRWRRRMPGVWPWVRSGGSRLLSWVMAITIVALVFVNYTPLVPTAARLDDWACTHVSATSPGLCRSGIGTAPLMLADGIIRVGLVDSGDAGPYDTSRQSGSERAVEARIFQNDRRSCSQAVPHVTLAVATMLSRTVDDTSLSADEVGIEDLRGSLLAQERYDADPRHRTKLCLVVANLGNLDSTKNTGAVAQVVQQLVLYAKHEPTFAGVVGFPFSSSARQALDALTALGHREIPIVSPSVTSDGLDHASNFWRIASTDGVQARALVDFLGWQVPAAALDRPLSVAVLVDDNDSYSNSLGNDFLRDANQAAGGRLHATEVHYQVQDRASILDAVRQAGQVDYVMLAGYAYDLDALETALEGTRRNVTILGGDGLYDLERYNGHPYAPVFATGYAPPLGPGLVGGQPCPGNFSEDYGAAFGTPVASGAPPSSITFLGAHAILSYDAVCMYGQALADLEAARGQVTAASVLGALPQISFDGMSGHTRFGDAANPSVPESKSVYVMCTDREPTPRLAARVDASPDGRARVSSGAAPSSTCPVAGA
jgi:ABC-type branched-subunit amino acid transport system substrate-binding protein